MRRSRPAPRTTPLPYHRWQGFVLKNNHLLQPVDPVGKKGRKRRWVKAGGVPRKAYVPPTLGLVGSTVPSKARAARGGTRWAASGSYGSTARPKKKIKKFEKLKH